MQSVTRSTTTLIFKHKCKTVCSQQVFLTMASFKIMEILFFGDFLVLPHLFKWKNPCFPCEDYSTFNLKKMTNSECLSGLRSF